VYTEASALQAADPIEIQFYPVPAQPPLVPERPGCLIHDDPEAPYRTAVVGILAVDDPLQQAVRFGA